MSLALTGDGRLAVQTWEPPAFGHSLPLRADALSRLGVQVERGSRTEPCALVLRGEGLRRDPKRAGVGGGEELGGRGVLGSQMEAVSRRRVPGLFQKLPKSAGRGGSICNNPGEQGLPSPSPAFLARLGDLGSQDRIGTPAWTPKALVPSDLDFLLV